MNYFCVPADFKKGTIDKYKKLNDTYKHARVIETYGNITSGNDFESARPVVMLPELGWEALADYVKYSKEHGIDFSYTINASHMQNKEFSRQGVLKIYLFLEKIFAVGIRSLIIALPSLIEIVRLTKFNFKIKASVVCQIVNANKAVAYKKMGVDRIVVDESINRDFFELRRIRRAFGEEVEVIVNSICHKNCPYRMFHYNQIACDSTSGSNEASINYYNHKCLLRRYENISNLLKLTWIRPEDIKLYKEVGINYFKIQGRHTVDHGDPKKTVEYYFRESYEGDLLELLDLFNPTSSFRIYLDNKSLDNFIQPFYQKEDFCRNNCERCNYCESIARRIIDEKKLEEIFTSAAEFYHTFDQFGSIVNSVINSKKNNKKLLAVDMHPIDESFNFKTE